MNELKPCPFCGGEKLVRMLHLNDRVSICCHSCTAKAWEEDWQKRSDHISQVEKKVASK